jgi:hypothetical protein
MSPSNQSDTPGIESGGAEAPSESPALTSRFSSPLASDDIALASCALASSWAPSCPAENAQPPHAAARAASSGKSATKGKVALLELQVFIDVLLLVEREFKEWKSEFEMTASCESGSCHEDLKTTMRYMHLSPAARESAIRLLDGRPEIAPIFGDIVESGALEG